MKKDCAYTRKSLRKYLRGHLFKYEQIRIARHLNICPVCRSEFQSIKKVADTKQLLKDITPPEGLGQQVKAAVSRLARLKVLLYRPLWLIGIIGLGVVVYINIIAPIQRDVEIENIEKSLPPALPVASSPTVTPVAAPAQQAAVQQPASKTTPSAPAVDPLVITISPATENAVRRINEVMRGHGQLSKMKFSDSVREISGNLTAKELLTFFNRIEQAGKVAYSRARFESFPTAQPIPFLIKMKNPPKVQHPGQAEYKPPEAAGEAALPVSAPTASAR